MRSWEWDWFIGWTAATIIILGIVTAVYFGATESSTKFYASMDKCTTAGGTFIPMGGGEAICMIGNKQ
jgi:hypothetical protein